MSLLLALLLFFFFFGSDLKSSCALENEVDNANIYFYEEDSEEMYVGGPDYVSKINVNSYNTEEVRAEGNSVLLIVGDCSQLARCGGWL